MLLKIISPIDKAQAICGNSIGSRHLLAFLALYRAKHIKRVIGGNLAAVLKSSVLVCWSECDLAWTVLPILRKVVARFGIHQPIIVAAATCDHHVMLHDLKGEHAGLYQSWSATSRTIETFPSLS